jgi:hypothetical protein
MGNFGEFGFTSAKTLKAGESAPLLREFLGFEFGQSPQANSGWALTDENSSLRA